LQAIRHDVQHMALNAAIKCARIGELGRPLAVIAVELRAHAGLLEDSANRALETLQRLTAGSEQLARVEAGASAGQALTRAAERLQAASAAAEAELAAVAAQGQAVVDGLRGAVRELDFLGEIGAAMREAAAALAEEAAREHGAVDGELQAKVLEAIARSYTMAQERRVHALFADALERPATPAEAAGALEDALF
jgi:methyl-accepting chemotaxis protein